MSNLRDKLAELLTASEAYMDEVNAGKPVSTRIHYELVAALASADVVLAGGEHD